jgi:Ca2+/Na+ antiporter
MSRLQRNAGKNRRFLYILIVVSLVIALFVSIILGLIVLVASFVYFFYIGKSAKKSDKPLMSEMSEESQKPAVEKETIIERDVVRIPCKYCKTLVDPVHDKVCPNCGAPIDLS